MLHIVNDPGTGFDALDLEDINDSDDDEVTNVPSDSTSTKDTSRPETLYDVKPDNSIDDGYLAIWCFFQDLNRILAFVTQTWNEYKEGKLDITTASETINTAIDIVRSLEANLYKAFDKDCGSIIQIYYEGCCISNGLNPGERERPDDLFNMAAFEAAEQSFLATHIALRDAMGKLREVKIRQGDLANRTSMGNRQLFLNDQALLLEHLRMVQGINNYSIPFADEFTRACQLWTVDQKISFWLVFAAKCHLVSYHVLGDRYRESLATLNGTGLIIGSAVRQFRKNHNPGLWNSKNDKNLEVFLVKPIDAWTLPNVKEERERLFPVSFYSMLETMADADFCAGLGRR